MTAAPPCNYSSAALMGRIFTVYLRPRVGELLVAAVSMILVAASTAGNAWLMQPMLDKVFVEKNAAMLAVIPLAVLGLAIVKGFALYWQMVTMRNLGQRMVCDMQIDLYGHLLAADLATFHDSASGKLISRFTNDIQLLRHTSAAVFTSLAREVVTLIFLLAVMFYQSPALTIIALIAFPLAINPVLRLARRMRKVSFATQTELGNFTARLDETFQGIRIVKAYAREEAEKERASRIINSLYRLFAKASRIQAASTPLMETLSGIAIAGVVWYGGMEVVKGITTPGAFFSFVAAMVMAYKPAKTLANLSTNLQEGIAAAERLFRVMDTRPLVCDKPSAPALKVTGGAIEFKEVSFAYEPDRQVLEGLSLSIPVGAKVAFVGPSGGGKSTLFNLLLRFYDPASGGIFIDKQDIREVSLSSLRHNIGIVTQETILFDDSALANIAYGLENAGREEVMEAARLAGAHEFLSQLPQGYDTMIGQHGVKLSGGQRQRIAIARAFLKKAPILLLDEATSALDPTTEAQVQQALEMLMHGRTCLVIAHKLSSVINADIIHVVRGGAVVEKGTHIELMQEGGVYAALYSREENGREAA